MELEIQGGVFWLTYALFILCVRNGMGCSVIFAVVSSFLQVGVSTIYINLIHFVLFLCEATRTWIQPVIKGTPPAPRDSHSCTTVGDKLFVFGGTDGRNPLRDLHILDTCELPHIFLLLCFQFEPLCFKYPWIAKTMLFD